MVAARCNFAPRPSPPGRAARSGLDHDSRTPEVQRSADALPNLQFLARQLTQFALGMQALEQHDLSRAEERLGTVRCRAMANFDRLKDEADAKAKERHRQKEAGRRSAKTASDARCFAEATACSNLSVMSLELRAGLLMAKKLTGDAKKLYSQAAQEEKALGYREPPAYIRPVGETEAAAFMAASDWTGAKAGYKDALVERPRSGFPLYGIAMASEQAGDITAATTEYTEFLATWKSADSDLPQLAHAHAYLASHKRAAASK